MIYLDHAATTKIDKRVLAKMSPYLNEKYANPSSIYRFAQESRATIDNARKVVADILGCKPSEIYFTGSGTESNNWAIFGAANATSKNHIISSCIEHHSVLHPLKELGRRGYHVTFLNVNRYGLIDLKDLGKSLNQETFLVSIMYGQNEIGTVENIKEIGKTVRSRGILFHTDACQAAGMLSLKVDELGVDLMTLNGGKTYGPKGVGVLYIRKGIQVTPLIYGGGQEHRLRGGTENVAGIVGLAEALKIAELMRNKESKRLTGLRDRLIKILLKRIPRARLNGHPSVRLPNNINISIPGVESESLLLRLDMEGICASSGSACASGLLEPSHVLLGIGLDKKLAKSSIRLTLGRENGAKDVERVAKVLPKIVRELENESSML